MSSSSGGFWPGEETEGDEPEYHDMGSVVDDVAEEDSAVTEPELKAEPEAATEPEPVAEPEPPADEESIGWEEEEPEPEVEPEPVIAHRPGEIDVPGGIAVIEGAPFGNGRSVGIVVGRFNSEISNGLLESALEALAAAGVQQDRITVMPVPGAFELPIGAMALAKTRRYSCVIGLGCVIRGETPHFDFVATEAASGLQLAGLETGVPVSFGVLTVDTVEQAEARIGKGGEAARAGLEMADIFSQVRAQVRATG
ncbi:MAG TPA: 6,7-dimethyl-8-ribityllumazine synthase [Gaiellaceae bacterium]|jgi:6,7-dimethyl-8-ribityllumazine synthase